MLEKIKLWFEKFTQAFTACILAMVQGDISVISLKHIITASEVGALTGLAFVVSTFIKIESKYLPIYLTGLFSAVFDYVVHMPMFKGEALVTGACAMTLAFIYEKIIKKQRP
jgi:hypothetical protein